MDGKASSETNRPELDDVFACERVAVDAEPTCLREGENMTYTVGRRCLRASASLGAREARAESGQV